MPAPEVAVEDGQGIDFVRDYLVELGVEDTSLLPDRELVLAAGNALLQRDEKVLPPHTDAVSLKDMRDSIRGHLPMLYRFSQAAYNSRVRGMLGREVTDFDDSEFATTVRDKHPEVPEDRRVEFERLLGDLFIGYASTLGRPGRRPLPGMSVLFDIDEPGPRMFWLDNHNAARLPDVQGSLVQLGPRLAQIFTAIDETTRGMWNRLAVVTDNEFIGSATESLAWHIAMTGRIAVRTGDLVGKAHELRSEGERFQVVHAGNLAVMSSDVAGPLMEEAAEMMDDPDGILVLQASSPGDQGLGGMAAAKVAAESKLGHPTLDLQSVFSISDPYGRRLGSGNESSAVFSLRGPNTELDVSLSA